MQHQIEEEDFALLGRSSALFKEDIFNFSTELNEALSGAKCLVIGAAGTIGQAVTLELFKRNPKSLHAVDISENNMVELVRSIRSTLGYSKTDFKTFSLDCGSNTFSAFMNFYGPYDYVFNLSALKHVRSEKDPFTLMRMIEVNIFNTLKILELTKKGKLRKYFCVSTDKAANPVNMMGASKRIMELFAMNESQNQELSMARFANVAFSDGSLLHGFTQRFLKRQPISAPNDVKRYFVTKQESGELCMMSGLLGTNRQIFFPKLSPELHLIKFSEIAEKYLRNLGYEPYICESEDEARSKCKDLIRKNQWPCYFFRSDTTGEKSIEEFFTDNEKLVLDRFNSIGIINNKSNKEEANLTLFVNKIKELKVNKKWSKQQLVEIFEQILPDFKHIEKGKNLDQRM